MPKIIVAHYFQETNSFHPNPTAYEDFGVTRGEDLISDGRGVVNGAVDQFAKRSDVEIVPTYGAGMGAGGTITHECFEQISSECLEAIQQNSAGADALYFSMHGAMAADIEKDPEGYMLQEARNILGPDVPIVISLDMHGTVTRRMLRNMQGASILHTYPHIDWYETGERAATMLLSILDGAKPVIASVYTPTMVRGDELKTATGVHGTFIRHLERLEERDDVLAGGIMLGHPPTDCPEQGSRIIIVTDNNRELAEREALRIGQNFWDMRERMQCVLYSVEEAIENAKKANGSVVFSDAADATSSGSPGTSNDILKGFLKSDYTGRVLFPIRDEPAVKRAMEAGIGSTITVPLGGTKDSRFTPIEVEVTVEVLSLRGDVPIAVLRAGNITIVAATQGGILCDRWMYTELGQEPKTFDVIIQKLPHTPLEYYDEWAVRNMTIDVPGAASPNIKTLGHEIVPRPIYPLDEDMTFTPEVEVFEQAEK
ncbi:MAG: M81 family metallopeptidase [Candidatus Poribacteria bacterium]|nr:M81 family metallopeptidase [Candidatus Poribacteria bacterium]MDE0506033.1 M81 family metallopeptidase [Candidatus Poribacteria bacterium]